jgi:hypothetical protein
VHVPAAKSVFASAGMARGDPSAARLPPDADTRVGVAAARATAVEAAGE